MSYRHECYDLNVYEVITQAIDTGEATVFQNDSGTLIYSDPYFGKDVPLRDLRYNSELGLHVREDK